MYDIATDHCQQ